MKKIVSLDKKSSEQMGMQCNADDLGTYIYQQQCNVIIVLFR